MRVRRNFSKKMAHRTMRKWVLKSASLSAMGVAVSPGIKVIAAEAAAAAAVNSRTVVFFSSKVAMLLAWKSVEVAILDAPKKESSAMATATRMRMGLFLSISFIDYVPFSVVGGLLWIGPHGNSRR